MLKQDAYGGITDMTDHLIKRMTALICVLLMCASLCGCSIASRGNRTSGDSRVTATTASGNEYRSYVNGRSARVEYLSAILEIDDAKFVYDDLEDQTYIVLEMTFRNDSTLYRRDGEENTTFYLTSLDSSFVIQAVQDGKVTEPRTEAESETIEEDNCYQRIDSGESLDCEMYIPVEEGNPVTVQVLNPDGEDTVMAELTFTPEEDW